jgi:nicotinamidase/pyrazinamidase
LSVSQAHIRTALIAVDVQHDFLPGGSLAVADGDQVIAPILELAACCDELVATRDFHPVDHVSFTTRGGQWPVHCVAGTQGARIHAAIDRLAHLVVSKGMDPELDAYSGFDGTGLDAVLRSLGVTRIVIGGLATDYCVRATALAARRAGFPVIVAAEGVRAVEAHAGDGNRALEEMRAGGVVVAALRDVVATVSA